MDQDIRPQAPWWQPGLILFFRLSAWIAGPILLALALGKWLDHKFGTEPWLFVFCVIISFLISSAGLVIESGKAMKEIETDAAKALPDQPKGDIAKGQDGKNDKQ